LNAVLDATEGSAKGGRQSCSGRGVCPTVGTDGLPLGRDRAGGTHNPDAFTDHDPDGGQSDAPISR
jgi:hypothetical protein